jgi:hypothetical protein
VSEHVAQLLAAAIAGGDLDTALGLFASGHELEPRQTLLELEAMPMRAGPETQPMYRLLLVARSVKCLDTLGGQLRQGDLSQMWNNVTSGQRLVRQPGVWPQIMQGRQPLFL